MLVLYHKHCCTPNQCSDIIFSIGYQRKGEKKLECAAIW